MDTIKGFTAWPHPPPQVWLILLGHLSSQSHLVPGGRRKIRSLQFQLANHWDKRRSSIPHPVPTSQEVLEDLWWWSDSVNLLQGQPLGIRNQDMLLYMDVSLESWGASFLDEEASGVSSPQELSMTPPTISHGFRTRVRIEKLRMATIHSNLLPYKHAHELFRRYYFTQNFIRDKHLQMNN